MLLALGVGQGAGNVRAADQAVCPQGELPPLGRPEAPDWRGWENASLPSGATHVYCLSIAHETSYISARVADRLGQCLWNRLTVTPPNENSLNAKTMESRDTSVGYPSRSLPGTPVTYLPRGIWTIRIDSLTECNAKYKIWVDPTPGAS